MTWYEVNGLIFDTALEAEMYVSFNKHTNIETNTTLGDKHETQENEPERQSKILHSNSEQDTLEEC